MKTLRIVSLFIVVLVLSATFADAQKRRPKAKAPAKPQEIIFAVLGDGKTLEPIAFIDKGALESTNSSGVDGKLIAAFNRTYYRPNGTYSLIFGGAKAGTVTVKSSDATSDCSANMATVTTTSPKAKLKGMVMALATNASGSAKAKAFRRMPTVDERAEMEKLIRAEYTKNKVDAKTLRSHNLTAIDVNHDGVAELVGSYWVETSPTSRALLFFIADKGTDGKYAFGFSEFRSVKQDEVMNADITTLDKGTYHELFLDSIEFDGDDSNEIFTYTESFEGAGFTAYGRENGKWVRVFEGSNYHCAY